MKKTVFTLLLALVAQLSMAQTATQLFGKYRDAKGAEYVSVPSLMVKMLASKIKSDNAKAVVESISGVKVLTLDGCKKSVRKKFKKGAEKLRKAGYDDFFTMRDSDEANLVLVSQDDRYVRELLIVDADTEGTKAVLVSGRINHEDIAVLIGQVEDL